MESPKNIVLASTGSVAAVRTPQIRNALISAGYAVKVVATDAAKVFIKEEIEDLIDEEGHWVGWNERGEVLHIDLRKWADLLLIAPLDANTLAKIANGMSDNILVSSI